MGWAAKQQTFFLTVLETGKLKVKEPADVVSGESSLPGLQMAIFSLYLHGMEKERKQALSSLFL